MRIFDEAKSAPKRVINGGAVTFELGGESAVHNGATTGFLY